MYYIFLSFYQYHKTSDYSTNQLPYYIIILSNLFLFTHIINNIMYFNISYINCILDIFGIYDVNYYSLFSNNYSIINSNTYIQIYSFRTTHLIDYNNILTKIKKNYISISKKIHLKIIAYAFKKWYITVFLHIRTIIYKEPIYNNQFLLDILEGQKDNIRCTIMSNIINIFCINSTPLSINFKNKIINKYNSLNTIKIKFINTIQLISPKLCKDPKFYGYIPNYFIETNSREIIILDKSTII